MSRLIQRAAEVLFTDPVSGAPLDTVDKIIATCNIATAALLTAICLSLALALKEF